MFKIDCTESGRSLTEVLGVLAIMGVLSMIAFQGFTSAMNQHRANELINEANKRAVVVAMQITAGRDALSIQEFQDPEGYTFGVERNPGNSNQFNITLNPVPAKVCQKMKAMIGTETAIRVISDTCHKITFNNDLSKTRYASDNQTPTECEDNNYTWCDGTGSCQQEVDCCKGKVLGICQACQDGAVMTSLAQGSPCDYNNDGVSGDGICAYGQCKQKPANVTCNVNTGTCTCNNGGTLCNLTQGLCCSASEMCNTSGGINGGTCVTLSAEGSECTTNADCATTPDKPWCKVTAYTNCNAPTVGTCTALDPAQEIAVVSFGKLLININPNNWWSAKNWCEAQGKRLINIEDFQAYQPDGTRITTGLTGNSPMCAQGKVCDTWNNEPYNQMWQGSSPEERYILTDAKDEHGELYSSKFSPIAVSFASQVKKVTMSIFWTASGSNRSPNCSELTVGPGSGMVKYSYRFNENLAVCK